MKFVLNNAVVSAFILQVALIISFFSPIIPIIPDPKINNRYIVFLIVLSLLSAIYSICRRKYMVLSKTVIVTAILFSAMFYIYIFGLIDGI